MNRWKIAGVIAGAGLLGGALSFGSIILYWKMQTPQPLPPTEVTNVSLPVGKSYVTEVPTKQYEYLGSYVFNTQTTDSKGTKIWSTQWMRYNPDLRYKFVTPDGLEPGEFSVTMNIDYELNPMIRAEGSVKFLNLTVHKDGK